MLASPLTGSCHRCKESAPVRSQSVAKQYTVSLENNRNEKLPSTAMDICSAGLFGCSQASRATGLSTTLLHQREKHRQVKPRLHTAEPYAYWAFSASGMLFHLADKPENTSLLSFVLAFSSA